MSPRSRSYEQSTLYPLLRENDEMAIEYLNDALQDADPRVFLLALRQVAEARGMGMTDLARETGLDRTGLYKVLSDKGNPEWASLASILDALGFGITIAKKVS